MSSYMLSIAPMMGRTDRHYRFFMRQITKKTLLYSEMITTQAILRGNKHRLLSFSDIEKPVSLQLGGSNPKQLAECAKIGEEYGYDEINLNVGCPSDRVQHGNFGACLMSNPELVADMLFAMKSKVSIPVTIKHRIGIDNLDRYEDMENFISVVSKSGCSKFIIHARIALLKGLSAQQNRVIPPLRYKDVYKAKKKHPHLNIEINGGIHNLSDVMFHVKHADSVMIGRAAYNNPYLFHLVDSVCFSQKDMNYSRKQVLENLIPYVESQAKKGVPSSNIIRHTHGIFFGQKNSKEYKKYLTNHIFENKDSAIVLKSYVNSL